MKIHYCTNCGTKIEDGAKFCYKCGSEVPSIKENKTKITKRKVKENSNIHTDTLKDINKNIELENNQMPIVNRLLIAAGVFAVLTVLPFMDWSPVTGFWALAMISLFLFITSLTTAWMFRGRSKKLQSLISGENLLAEWTLTREMKENYINYLFNEERGKNFAIFTVISVIAAIVFGVFILFIDEGKLAMLGVLVALILFLSLFAFGMPYYYRYTNRKGDGRILIGAKYAYINGYFHNWDFPLSGLSGIKIIKKPFYGIKLAYYYTDRTLQHSEEIVIPVNKDIDLQSLISEMKKLNSKRRPKKRNKR